MKDLEAIHKEYQEKISLAEEENAFEKKYGCKTSVLKNLYIITIADGQLAAAGRILRDFTPDEIMINDCASGQRNSVYGRYKMDLVTSVRGGTEFGIMFNIGKITYWIKMPYDVALPIIVNHCVAGRRSWSESEISTYTYSLISENGVMMKNPDAPCVKWAHGQMEYSGGRFRLVDVDAIDCIILEMKEIKK